MNNSDLKLDLLNNPIIKNKYSLDPDMVLGWKPKTIQV
jgi:hypothetical protein